MNPSRDPNTPLKISAIQNPIFKVELPNGTIESYDPFELIEKITEANAALAAPDQPYPGTLIAVAVAVPRGSEPQVALRAPLNFHEVLMAEFHLKQEDFPGLSARNVMLSLWAAINEYVEGLEVTKKLSGLVQRNSSSQASSPAR